MIINQEEIFEQHISDKVLISRIYIDPLQLINKVRYNSIKITKRLKSYLTKHNIQMTIVHDKVVSIIRSQKIPANTMMRYLTFKQND